MSQIFKNALPVADPSSAKSPLRPTDQFLSVLPVLSVVNPVYA